MMRMVRWSKLVCIVSSTALCSPNGAKGADEAARDFAEFTAPQAVREGNRLLDNGAPQDALRAYDHAETLRPDAREIAFGKGLAHYALNQFDEARAAFEQAQSGMNDGLADDALYSQGTCDHAEALRSADRPEAAIAHLESAMQKYRSTLEHRPDHAAARDANRKAAVMRRQLKQRQEQQQNNEGDRQDQKQDQDKDQKQKSPQQNEQDQQKQQQDKQQQGEKTDEQEKNDQDRQKDSQEKNQEQEKPQENSQPSADPQQQEKQEHDSQAQLQERASREQAQRKLREMVQAMRDRKKNRAEEVRRQPVAPVDKDW